MFELFSDIYFIVYKLYYVDQNNNLGIRVSFKNWDRGSTYFFTEQTSVGEQQVRVGRKIDDQKPNTKRPSWIQKDRYQKDRLTYRVANFIDHTRDRIDRTDQNLYNITSISKILWRVWIIVVLNGDQKYIAWLHLFFNCWTFIFTNY
jgi:hypothetical protein